MSESRFVQGMRKSNIITKVDTRKIKGKKVDKKSYGKSHEIDRVKRVVDIIWRTSISNYSLSRMHQIAIETIQSIS